MQQHTLSSLSTAAAVTATAGSDISVNKTNNVNETWQEKWRKAKASVFGDADFHLHTRKIVQKAAALDEVQRLQSVKNNDNFNVNKSV